MESYPSISDSELELMRIIWAHGGNALFAQIMETLKTREKDWKANTVLTFLARLTEKGMLIIKKHGRRNEYFARVSEEEYACVQTDTFLNKIYEGDARGLVSALLQHNRLSSADIEELTRFWNAQEEDK